MRIVAVAAILDDRCVLPQVGPAFLGMAVEAGVVNRLARKQTVGRVAVRVMASRAVHLALVERMRVGLQRLRALLLVAVVTDPRLGRRLQDGVLRDMNLVAIGARDLVDARALPCRCGHRQGHGRPRTAAGPGRTGCVDP